MGEEFEAIKNELEELRQKQHTLINNMDITGGETGIRNNNRAWNTVHQIDKRIKLLTKRLFSTIK